MVRTIVSGLLLVCAIAFQAEASTDDSSRQIAEIQAQRALKDSLFRFGSESPLQTEDIPSFTGLPYFPADLQWRVTGRLHRYGRTRQIPLPDTEGSTIAVERFGRFVFHIDGKAFWLETYRSLQGGSLTVYFTDETNGISTYSAGRYAAVFNDIYGSYVIDFNDAYNPYCAYNEDYTCPLPPAQNHLPFQVPAGELATGPDVAD